jgi:hypothetical protein
MVGLGLYSIVIFIHVQVLVSLGRSFEAGVFWFCSDKREGSLVTGP